MTDQYSIFLFILHFQVRSDGFLTYFSELNGRENQTAFFGGKPKRRAGNLNGGR